jgi:hypothetical protein
MRSGACARGLKRGDWFLPPAMNTCGYPAISSTRIAVPRMKRAASADRITKINFPSVNRNHPKSNLYL